MKKYLILWVISLLFFPLQGLAKAYQASDVTMVHLQDARRYVCNPDQVLSAGSVAHIDSLLYHLEQSTGIEVVVVAVKEVADDDCFNFALQVGQQNGVGKKKSNNGLVVLLATENRCIQFVTGYGLEGTLTDAQCKRIQNRYMNDYFREGKWDEGLISGMDAVVGILDGTMKPENEEDDEALLWYLEGFIFLMGFCAIGYLIIADRKRRKCPRCKKLTLKRSDSYRFTLNGVTKEHVTYICSHCGQVVERDEKINDGDNFSGGSGGPIIFGSGRSFRGGGGFSGGSFGGGSFGGGGSGSRF